MFKKSLILLFSLFFVFTVSAIAQGIGIGMGNGNGMGMGQGMHKGMHKRGIMNDSNSILPGGKWWKNPEVVQKLNLTDEQVNKIDSIFLNYMDKLIDLKAQLEKKNLDFKTLIENNNFDRNSALQMFDEIANLRVKIKRELFLMKLDIRDQLTPEQRATLKTLRENFRREMMMNRMKMRGERRRGGRRGMGMR